MAAPAEKKGFDAAAAAAAVAVVEGGFD